MPTFNTRWCAQCSVDWPALQLYNLCPKCGRCTAAETSDERPDEFAASNVAARYRAFEKFLRQREEAEDAIIDELEAALARTPTIPDPPGTPQNFGLAGRGHVPNERNFHHGRPPTDEDVKRWRGEDA